MSSDRVLLIAADSHVGPSLRNDLRPYCEAAYLETFDAYADETDTFRDQLLGDPSSADLDYMRKRERSDLVLAAARLAAPGTSNTAREAYASIAMVDGLRDPAARERDMDADGVAADVIFAGGQNGELLPFVGAGLSVGPSDLEPELQIQSGRIFNRWLVDFCASSSGRHIGCMQIPIFDLDATIAILHEFRTKGLKAVNFPAPRQSFPPYNDPMYEPLWSACEELDLPLCSHSTGGDEPMGITGPGGMGIHYTEVFWLGRRALWQLIFGGVFERHPKLRFVLTEQGTSWVSDTVKDMDSLFHCQLGMVDKSVSPKPASEYWAQNCAVVASFPARHEIAQRNEVGVNTLLWGSDYPHYEGTWPRTRDAIRYAFQGVDEEETRRIVGSNALGIFDLDITEMAAIAARIGPTVAELRMPLADLPDHRGLAFRAIGQFA